jgi:5-methylcytosine-specific restriction endonuclease McrA
MASTLLLNATYEPMKVISWQRAITLLFLNKAELVEAYDEVIRSINHAVQKPSVVRLRRYARQDRKVKFSRVNVYRRDGFSCQYCGAQPGASSLTLDHVLPRARGGRTEWTNIVTACTRCNAAKADRTPEQAAMPLPRRPFKPSSMPMVSPQECGHPAWMDYLGLAS